MKRSIVQSQPNYGYLPTTVAFPFNFSNDMILCLPKHLSMVTFVRYRGIMRTKIEFYHLIVFSSFFLDKEW